jgi:hypothetical protein
VYNLFAGFSFLSISTVVPTKTTNLAKGQGDLLAENTINLNSISTADTD